MISPHTRGFSLIELMVALAVSALVLTGILSFYHAQVIHLYRKQAVLEMQQNIRAAIHIMQKEISLAGFDASNSWGLDQVDNDGDFDIDEPDEQENDRNLDQVDNDHCVDRGSGPDAVRNISLYMDETFGIKVAGPHMVRFNMDLNGDRDSCDRNEEVSYGFSKKYDEDMNGIVDGPDGNAAPMGRASGKGHPQPLVNHIQALAFAYAYDFNQSASGSKPDRRPDLSRYNHIIWAFDHDGDGWLDRILDTNDDGRIDRKDRPGGAEAGIDVPVHHILAVRVWVLARSSHPVRGHRDMNTYVVGGNHIRTDDHYMRLLHETIIHCPNASI